MLSKLVIILNFLKRSISLKSCSMGLNICCLFLSTRIAECHFTPLQLTLKLQFFFLCFASPVQNSDYVRQGPIENDECVAFFNLYAPHMVSKCVCVFVCGNVRLDVNWDMPIVIQFLWTMRKSRLTYIFSVFSYIKVCFTCLKGQAFWHVFKLEKNVTALAFVFFFGSWLK